MMWGERGGAVQQAGGENDGCGAAPPAVRAGSGAAFRSPNPRGALNPEPPGALLQLGNFLKDLICLYLDSVSLSCRMECT